MSRVCLLCPVSARHGFTPGLVRNVTAVAPDRPARVVQLPALHTGVTKGAHYSSGSEYEVESRMLVKVVLRSAERAKSAARRSRRS
jgi:hypothetical protein